MTEEDTIKALKKWTYEDLKALLRKIRDEYLSSNRQTDIAFWKIDRDNAIANAGWTKEEWVEESRRRSPGVYV